MRILVTNDDGIDSVGLHVLAQAMLPLGDVTVVAPDQEYSGAGTSLGAMHLTWPEVHDARIDGIHRAWSVSAPPSLCILYSRLGIFGDPFDLVVAGINPGINVGRSVYHSGTVGAALTARNGGLTGVAVSQEVTGWGIEGQGGEDTLDDQYWDSAATVAATAVGAVIADPPPSPSVLNLNVPNLPVDQMRGWKETPVGAHPPRTLSTAELEPKPGHAGTYLIRMDLGDALPLDPNTDGGAIADGWVSLTWLDHLSGAETPSDNPVATALGGLFA